MPTCHHVFPRGRMTCENCGRKQSDIIAEYRERKTLVIAAGIMSHIQTSPGHVVTISPEEVSRAKDWPHNCQAGDDDGADSDVGDMRQVCMPCSAREAIGAARRVLEALEGAIPAYEKTAGG